MTREMYPVLKIPQQILDIAVANSEEEFQVQNKKQIFEPTPPRKPRIAKPIKPGVNTMWKQVAIALLVSVSWAFSVRTGAWVISVMATMVVGYIFYKQKQDYKIQKAEFDQATLNYMVEQEVYEEELEKWHESLTNNEISIQKRQNKIKTALQNFQRIIPFKPIPDSIATAKAVRTRLAELTQSHLANNQIVLVGDECDF